MPSLFSRAFLCACSTPCTTEDVPKTSTFPVPLASTPTSNSWLARVLRASGFEFAIIMRQRERKQGDGTEHDIARRRITHECQPRPSKAGYRRWAMWSSTLIHRRSNNTTTSEVSSIPSLSRLQSTVSSVSAASALPSPVRYDLYFSLSKASSPLMLSPSTQANDGDDDDVMYTLKDMQAFVPESPRISHRNSLPPMSISLEGGEDGNSSRRPSYSIHVPQLYPYTLSEDDIWAEEMVANILAVRLSSLPPPAALCP
jgi:hypothetical protein